VETSENKKLKRKKVKTKEEEEEEEEGMAQSGLVEHVAHEQPV
jgi:hypothetical protein